MEVGVLSANYPDVESAVEDMKRYMEVLEGNLSVLLIFNPAYTGTAARNFNSSGSFDCIPPGILHFRNGA